MKRKLGTVLAFLLCLTIALSAYGCKIPDNQGIIDSTIENDDTNNIAALSVDETVMREAKLSFHYLWNETQRDRASSGYGLVRDRWPENPIMASTASTGFALAALPAAVENGWVSEGLASERALGTLKTVLKLEHLNGFYYHFINLETGLHASGSEISPIDTTLLVAGALVAGEYFGGAVLETALEIYKRVNWMSFTYTSGTKRFFYMSATGAGIYSGGWTDYAEQLVMYVLAAGTPVEEYRIPKNMFYDFKRSVGGFGDNEKFIYSPFGSIFTYQFSHAFVDFKGYVDEQGVDWYENSVKATLNDRAYCIAHPEFKAFNENSWGLTACDTPTGYSGHLGAYPRDLHLSGNDGTVATAGAVGSMPFAPELVKKAVMHYDSMPQLKSRYGFRDSINFNGETEWYAPDCIGIDKGISTLMVTNYYNENNAWKYFMQNDCIKNALPYLGLTKAA